MMSIDLEAVLVPVSDSEPTGPDLGYDPSFAAIERAAQGRPQQQIGTTVVPGEDPDWKKVLKQSTELLGKTRDLRVAVFYLKALVRTEGWAGLAGGLALIRGLVERYWDGALHPKLDPDDGNDPTIRVNILKELCAPELLAIVRTLPLCISPMLGPISLQQVESASGDGAAAAGDAGGKDGAAALSMAAIDGTFDDAPLDDLRAREAVLRAASETLTAIDSVTAEKVGIEQGPNLEQLGRLLAKAVAIVGAAVARRAPAQGGDGAGDVPVNGAGRRTAPVALGEINSRDDVIRVLDRICAYYAKNEPSSPIPILLQRSKKLVTMTFAEIVNELVPDASNQLRNIKGSD
jgi:type VI secretion system protein ImpA